MTASAKSVGFRLTVRPEHEAEVAKLYDDAGFKPLSVGRKEDGNIVFVLPKVADDQMYRMMTAVPAHYSVLQGYVVGSKPERN